MKQPKNLTRPGDKLGVLLPGLGAVATTTIAGVMLARRGLGDPVGSLFDWPEEVLDYDSGGGGASRDF